MQLLDVSDYTVDYFTSIDYGFRLWMIISVSIGAYCLFIHRKRLICFLIRTYEGYRLLFVIFFLHHLSNTQGVC